MENFIDMKIKLNINSEGDIDGTEIEFEYKFITNISNEVNFIEMQEKSLNFFQNMDKKLNNNSGNILSNYKHKILSNHYLLINFMLLVEKIPKFTIEKLLVDNEFTIEIILSVLKEFYSKDKKYDNLFFIPTREKIINRVFKFPDIISNCLHYQLINTKEYFLALFKMLYVNYLIDDQIFNKIVNLKMLKYLLIVIKVSKCSESLEKILSFVNTSIYLEEFTERVFETKPSNAEEFNNLLRIYMQIPITYSVIALKEKLMSISHNNVSFISLMLKSNNSDLMNLYVLSTLDLLKSNKLDQFSSFSFLIILYSFYFYIETINDEVFLFKILEKVFKMQGNIMQNLYDEKFVKIFYAFTQYINSKISKFVKINEDKDLEINNRKLIYTELEKEIINFENITKYLETDCMYLNKLKQEFEYNESSCDNKIQTENKIKNTNKTKYISIKFQKKFGNYEKKNQLLEFDDKENLERTIIKLNSFENSDLKIKLDKQDDFSDLNSLSAPIYTQDCLLGLSSEYPDRQELSLKSLIDIIDNQPLDLDFFLPKLAELLLKLSNNFEIENFDYLVKSNLTKLTIFDPIKMTQILCIRFFNEECGIKQKFDILQTIESASEEISKYYTKNKKIPKVNKLHSFFEGIIFPLLNYLKSKNMEQLIVLPDFDILLAKFLTVVSKIIKFSENHPYIYKALFESTELYKSIVNNKSFLIHKSIVLIDSLNFFTSVAFKFLDSNLLEIYPEYFPNYRFMINFLNENFNKVKKEELKIEMLKNMNNFIQNLDRVKNRLHISELIII